MIFDTTSSLKYLKDEAKEYCWELFQPVFEDVRFAVWSAASRSHQHHYGRGGLVYHIADVATLCKINNKLTSAKIDDRKLFTAALYHDVGKMWDYTPTNTNFTEWTGTAHKRNIHHISRSALLFQQNVDKLKQRPDWLDQIFVDDVLHAILSHHGLREWGSPVNPNSKLAFMLHLCDSISARMADAGCIDRNQSNKGENTEIKELNCRHVIQMDKLSLDVNVAIVETERFPLVMCSYNKVISGNHSDSNSPRLKCMLEHGHLGSHLDHSGVIWDSKPVQQIQPCSHNILIDDEHVMCELPHGHQGEHIKGEVKWSTKKEVRKTGTCFYCKNEKDL